MDELQTVPYVVYEGERARNERIVKRMVTAIIVALLAILATNAIWLYCWMQYDYETCAITASAEGDANYIGQDGDIINGDYHCQEKG